MGGLVLKQKGNRLEAEIEPVKVVDIEQSEEESLIIPVSATAVESDSYITELAFLEEPIEVMINPSSNPQDTTRLVVISINGRNEYFMRGEWKKTTRKYVERLALAKRDQWQFGYRHAPDGSVSETSTAMQSLRFGFQVRDDNPNGKAWLQKLLEQAV